MKYLVPIVLIAVNSLTIACQSPSELASKHDLEIMARGMPESDIDVAQIAARRFHQVTELETGWLDDLLIHDRSAARDLRSAHARLSRELRLSSHLDRGAELYDENGWIRDEVVAVAFDDYQRLRSGSYGLELAAGELNEAVAAYRRELVKVSRLATGLIAVGVGLVLGAFVLVYRRRRRGARTPAAVALQSAHPGLGERV